ncbi:MAG: formylglycine-generating enzyme family protein [Candidatus Limnocylindria bacterium]
MSDTCCAPSLPALDAARSGLEVEPSSMPVPPDLRLMPIEGGSFRMGSEDGIFPGDGESPVRDVALSPFAISAHAITNAQFGAFVAATGHRTDAERAGSSFVFSGFLTDASRAAVRRVVAGTPWWASVEGAWWQAPEGPGSSVEGRPDHPVVHVSHDDALAFCAAYGLRLPTEAEWELAARGGLEQCRYPWGDELLPDKQWRCNVWQGSFPEHNTAEDGWEGTAPVNAFGPNGYGLFNMVGNTWEWCSDWFTSRPAGGPAHDPRGPATGTARVMRGGSHLCHESYCFRYRVAARSPTTPDTATGHLGFRVARSLDP